jgi:glycosyltransferase involved in cell wall biosynthesis
VYFIILALIRLLTKTKVILLCHNVLPHESVPLQRPLTQLVFSLVDEAIVHGSTEKDLASNFIGADRITQLYHPLFDVLPESAQSTEQKTDSSALDMLVFGAIRPYKGTSILLDAMANLRSEGVNLRLTIAGEPFDDQHETILEKIAELHLEDLVQVRMEYIPNEDIEPLFKGCDVAMYPYLSATQSGSLAMAYACGAPVIATRVGGLTDVVADGVSGYLVEPTAEGVADGIRAFLAEPVSSESVLDFADRELSWERYAAELIKL